MHPNPRRIAPILIVLALVAGGIWWWRNGQNAQASGALAASGTIEAVDVHLAPELGGRVQAVLVEEGQAVSAGDVLAQLDTTLLEAQYAQAEAALAAAQANLEQLRTAARSDQGKAAIARAQLEFVQAQQALNDLLESTDIALAQAQLNLANANDAVFDAQRHFSGVQFPDVQAYQDSLNDAQDRLIVAESGETINEIGSLGASIQAAQDAVEAAQDRLGETQSAEEGCGNCDPDRMARAQDNLNGALNNLQTLQLQQQNAQIGAGDAIENAQDALQDAQENLAAAQAGPNAREMAIAQAALALAQAQLNHAHDELEEMGTGPDPQMLAAAQARYNAAQAALTAAEAGASPQQLAAAQAQVDVAQAALDAVEAQLGKMTLVAPAEGVVLSRAIEPGEVASPGATLFIIGRLTDLNITVYVPEDRYGLIQLGQTAQVSADSFPGEQFSATVTHIADQAEFTPRNVQTVSGRKSTVFAIELTIENSDGRLKPGMPADVEFGGN